MSDRERMAEIMRQLVLSQRYRDWTWEEISGALIAAGFGDVAAARREAIGETTDVIHDAIHDAIEDVAEATRIKQIVLSTGRALIDREKGND